MPIPEEQAFAGEIRVTFSKSASSSCVIRDLYQSGSLRLSPLRRTMKGGELSLIHLGGGAVAGDRLCNSIRVFGGATIHLQDQGSLKIFKSLDSAKASLEMDIEVRDESHFSYIGEPIVLYENARFSSQVIIEIQNGSASYVDVLSAGVGFHQHRTLGYDFVSSTILLYVGSELVLFDRLTNDRSDTLLFDDANSTFSAYPYLATFVAADTKGNESIFLHDVATLLALNSEEDNGVSIGFAVHERHISARILSSQRDLIYRLLAQLTALR